MGGLIATGVEKLVGEEAGDVLNRLWQSGAERLSKEGGPAGKELAERLTRYNGAWRELAGPSIKQIKDNPTMTLPQKLASGRAEIVLSKAQAGIYHLGPGNSELKRLISDIDTQQGPVRARNAWLTSMHAIGRPYAVSIGGRPRFTSEVPGLARTALENGLSFWNTNTKLSLAPLAHTTQPFNIAFLTGVGNAVKGLVKSIGSPSQAARLSLESGAAIEDLMRNWEVQVNGSLAEKTTRAIMRPLNLIGNINRSWAVSSAPHVLEDAFRKLGQGSTPQSTIRLLQHLDVDPNDLLRLGPQDKSLIYRAARKISDLSFPETNVMNVPPAWRQSSIGRVATMFKPFLFKQAKFLNDFVFKEVRHGNVKPLMAMAMISPTVGIVGSYLRAAAREGTFDPKQLPGLDKDHWADRVVWGMSQLGGLAIYGDIIGAMGSPRGNSRWISVFAGPVMSDAVTAMEDLSDLYKSKNPFLKLTKEINSEILPRIPIVGPGLQQHVSPRKVPKDFRGDLLKGKITKRINEFMGPTSAEAPE
jgi:hypothetical protein